MKRLIYIFTLTLVLVSCGSRSGYFSLEGRLLNLNQGEFYVYSPDGVFDGVDTIKVEGGRFTFETPCKEEGTIIIVFPNFSEQPVFAEPGKSVTIKGSASRLKEIEIDGTDANEQMNAFRKANKALRSNELGAKMVRLETAAPSVFACVREQEGNVVVSVFNFSSEPLTIDDLQLAAGTYTTYDGKQVEVGEDFTLNLAPWGYCVMAK